MRVDPVPGGLASPTERRFRILIADDDVLVRRLLRDTLEHSHMTVVAEAETGRQALELAVHYRPDVLLIDLLMPEGTGLDVVRRLTALGADQIRTVVLTSTRDEEAALMVLRAGAVGYLTKDMPIAELPRAIRGVMRGEAAVSRRLSLVLVERLRQVGSTNIGVRPVRSPLTPREWEVLDLLCERQSTTAIADRLVVSVETVRSHIKSILRKLEVNSRAAAVALSPSLRTPSNGVRMSAQVTGRDGYGQLQLLGEQGPVVR
jgi:DNA-binding NarL/FixJ family response regulator